MPEALWITFATIAMAPFIGSFLGVLIERLPAGRSVIVARSRCESCHHALAPQDMIPLLSWCLTKGRCRYCSAHIGGFYPCIELVALAIAAWATLTVSGWLVPASAIFGWTLLALAVIDWRHLVLPDPLTLFLAASGIAVTALLLPDRLLHHFIGAVAGYVALAAIAYLYARLRGRQGLGQGDAKLFGGLGAWVSWAGLPSILLVASALALGFVLVQSLSGKPIRPDSKLPFGTFLAAAGWVVWLYGPLVGG